MIYGAKEHAKGTDRRAQSKTNIDICVKILKQAGNHINIQSVKDCISYAWVSLIHLILGHDAYYSYS